MLYNHFALNERAIRKVSALQTCVRALVLLCRHLFLQDSSYCLLNGQGGSALDLHEVMNKNFEGGLMYSVKAGGPSPSANAALAQLIQQAKDTDVPKDIIERNIKKATDKDQADFVELTYEVYGYGGVGLVLEVLTDNHNRAASTIRDVVKKGGAKMADSGSVLFNFKSAGVIYVKADKVEGDDLLLAAMDAGAEDVIEPSSPDEEDDEDEEKYFKVITPVDQFGTVRAGLQEAGIPFDADSSGLELIPVSKIEADDEAMDLNKAFMDKLLDLDDVDAVFSNQK